MDDLPGKAEHLDSLGFDDGEAIGADAAFAALAGTADAARPCPLEAGAACVCPQGRDRSMLPDHLAY